ncbi:MULTISPECIES: Crp/Fnr family transcriptional regulator [unclassified Mesorhizobium]|uniref:Crp/Fnr family transcriptional regulator n=1 Tax=unclassified Mesorhizobium TaxID=325217 RepID=UPI001CC9E9F2|nr:MULTISPECIES: Crp/Fnr family transcriptional regulator [unclassified Mesorhizobium]MBZ9740864.1 Crp/Fnr family transcriptional regulator [Mesorhizobium sp. CO1-1-4]MBZ9804039.1 Crp/Fnr family transcriptional regulator [Mesorhizobium sp. ES1-6]
MSPTSSSDVLIRKLETISEIREAEIAVLKSIPIQEKDFSANHDLVREGERPVYSFVVLDGLIGSTKYTSEGKRQITSFFVAGDIPDLHGLHLSVMDCNFSTLTPARVGFMRHDVLRSVCDQHPRIATAFWRSTLIDAAMYREWVTNVGRREAYTRMAHILCELIFRLRAVGRIEDHIADIPITQAALGDALGLSTVHVNRMLQELRRDGLIATTGTRMHAIDWPRLTHAGDFDTTYLHQKNPAD